MHLARKKSHRSLRNRTRARGAIVRTDRRRLCAEFIGNCRLKRQGMQRNCTRLGTLSEDPIGLLGGDANFYLYVNNSPVNFRDPSGLVPAGNPLFNLASNSTFDTGFGGGGFNDIIFGGPVSTPSLSSFDTSSNFTGLSFPPNQGFSNFLDQQDRQNSLAFPNALVNADLNGIAQARLSQNQNPVTEAALFADVASSVTPIVSDLRDFTEVATGRHIRTGEQFSTRQKIANAIGLALPVVGAAIVRRLLGVADTVKSIDNVRDLTPAEVRMLEIIDTKAGRNVGNVRNSGVPDHPSVGPGKAFTQTQKKNILDANRQQNAGTLRSEQSGAKLVPGQQNTRGVTPSTNEAQVDHIIPKSKGGSNSSSNAQILSREENLRKSNK